MKIMTTCILMSLATWSFQCELPTRAAEPRSLDAKLLDDSPGSPHGAVDRELFHGDGKQGQPPHGTDGPSLDRRLADELGEAAISEDAHPLMAIAGRMRDVQARLAGHPTDPQTASMQQQIVLELDRLLEQARNQASAGGETSGQVPPATDRQPGQTPSSQPSDSERELRQSPARQSTDEPSRANPDGEPSGSRTARRAMETLWNQLPARQREQLLQLAPERFLPKYETEIEEYFRRLSEEPASAPLNSLPHRAASE